MKIEDINTSPNDVSYRETCWLLDQALKTLGGKDGEWRRKMGGWYFHPSIMSSSGVLWQPFQTRAVRGTHETVSFSVQTDKSLSELFENGGDDFTKYWDAHQKLLLDVTQALIDIPKLLDPQAGLIRWPYEIVFRASENTKLFTVELTSQHLAYQRTPYQTPNQHPQM